MDKSFDQITQRAVSRMVRKANGDVKAILRIMAKARNHRENRAVVSFLSSLAR